MGNTCIIFFKLKLNKKIKKKKTQLQLKKKKKTKGMPFAANISKFFIRDFPI